MELASPEQPDMLLAAVQQVCASPVCCIGRLHNTGVVAAYAAALVLPLPCGIIRKRVFSVDNRTALQRY